MTAHDAGRDAAIASIIAEAARSTIDWDDVKPASLAIMLRGHAGRLEVSASTREILVHIGAVVLNAVRAFDRAQAPRRGEPAVTPDAPAPVLTHSGDVIPVFKPRLPYAERDDG